MAVIATTLVDVSPESLATKAKGLLKRVNKLRLLGLAMEGGAAAIGLPAFGLLAQGTKAVGDLFTGQATEKDMTVLKDAGDEIKKKSDGLIAPAEKRSPPEEIAAFRDEFGDILTQLNKTLIVFIDNLDRCLPRNLIHTLEAIRLFLFLPKTAFVIAADEDMVRHAVSEHFHNPSERLVGDYLDKLIQKPVRVPRVGIQEVRAYLFLLLASNYGVDSEKLAGMRHFLVDRLRQSWNPDIKFGVADVLDVLGETTNETLRRTFDMADRIAPSLAFSARVQGNPRIVKRMLNVVWMRISVAQKRHMLLDESVIIKLALFERCTDTAATEAFHNAINAASDGRPQFLADIEAEECDDKIIREKCPPAWAAHALFALDWATLDPKLANVDLRPAVYLARETVPLRVVSSAMSQTAVRAVEALLNTPTVSSLAARAAAQSIAPSERILVMEALIREMRRNATWTHSRSDFRGAVILAEQASQTSVILARFIQSLPFKQMPPWMSTMISGKTWAQQAKA
jgi:predicted KAP-like P-loop ATPase